DQAHDPEMTRWLAGYLRRTGRADEADQIEPPRPRPRSLKAAAPAQSAPEVSSHRPVVFLHGYNGSAETWYDFVVVFSSAGYKPGDMLVFDYNEMFGADEDTPIEEIAAKVEPRVRAWLRQRAGLSEDDDSHDADLPAPDWICHSMGGLVFRVVLKNAPGLVHRCVDLGTPHFGQAIGDYEIVADWTGDQTRQMSHGAAFLWDLAADWHYHGHRTDDILFIAGAATTDQYLDFEDGLAQDGLVNTFTTTMLTQADGEAFARRTFFVNRIHSTALDMVFGGKYASLVSLPQGENDPVFKLAHGYLNDTDYFADGAVPSQRQVMADDGMSEEKQDEVLRRVYGHGALFVQVMEPVTNMPKRVQMPIEYDKGIWLVGTPDNVVDALHWNGHEYTGDDDGLIRSSGSGGESCENGLVLLYGNIPTGSVSVTVGEPYAYEGPYQFPYQDTAVIHGGGTTLWRTRPGAVKPMSAVPVADGLGQVRTLVVSNSWLEAMGLVTSAEDLAGCVTAADATGANGYPAALSALLGLDPSDPAAQVRFGGIGVSDEAVELSLRVGDGPLARDAPFALQGKAEMSDDWRDLDDVVRRPGFWTVPLSADRFFRAVFRW
ncbi:MAG: hypothetical protein KBT68_06185, partial [bacterium]|nr:hypothetical protein [Candidatus Colisoma equi]